MGSRCSTVLKTASPRLFSPFRLSRASNSAAALPERERAARKQHAFYTDRCVVRTETNNHGGILGGISACPSSSGAAVKPAPSIALPSAACA